jgi:hypothetical protein
LRVWTESGTPWIVIIFTPVELAAGRIRHSSSGCRNAAASGLGVSGEC